MLSGEWLLQVILDLVTWCSDQLFSIYLFSYNGRGISLGNFMMWCITLSIVIDIFVILNGGAPGDDDWDTDDMNVPFGGNYDYWE